MSKKTTASAALQKPALLWHPLVHKRFSEELYYFLIRAPTSIAERLRKILDDIGIKGYSLYTIFGNFDMLLRVWLTNLGREQFKKQILSVPSIIRIEEFIVQKYHVLWHNSGQKDDVSSPDENVIAHLTPDRIQNAQEGKVELDHLEEYRKNGILISYNRVFKKDHNKFFVMMNYPPGVIVTEFDISDHLEKFIRAETKIIKVSAYSGIGFTRYLIKGVARDYYEILKFVVRLINAFSLLKIETNTILIADDNPIESDDIAFIGGVAEEEGHIVKGLIPELENATTHLQLFERHLLSKKIIEYRDLLGPSANNVLHDCFVHIIHRDESELAHAVQNYLGGFEKFLRDNFSKFTLALYQNDTGKMIAEVKKIVGLDKGKKASLGEWLEMYKHLAKACAVTPRKDVNTEIDALLGLLSQTVFQEATTWRNKFAHLDYGSLLQNWTDLIDFLAKFIPARTRFEATVSKKSGEQDA